MTELPELKQYQAAFERRKVRWKSEPSWLQGLREEAIRYFTEKGFPTTKQDAWRYTDVAPIRETNFIFEEHGAVLPFQQIEKWKQNLKGHFLIFCNGQYQKSCSSVPEGVRVVVLRDAAASELEFVKNYFANDFSQPWQNVFTSLNAALSDQGVFIQIKEGQRLQDPLHLVFFVSSSSSHAIFNPRIWVLMEKQSQALLAETFLGVYGENYFTNVVAEIFLEEGALLRHVKIQRENKNAFHMEKRHIRQNSGSSFSSLVVSLGGQLVRDDCHVELLGPEAESVLKGLYLTDQDQLLDQRTFVDHQQPSCKSNQIFKGLLAGNSRGVFSGKILVRQGAQKTDAHQTNKNLFLSDHAKLDTQPQLKILADDVKCSHGAAVGQLEEDSLFYLKSRGIDEKKASHMLAQGFARELIEDAGDGVLKETLIKWVDEKLEKQLQLQSEKQSGGTNESFSG